MRHATEDYLKDEDSLGQWIEEFCIVGPNEKCAFADLWASWKKYREQANEYVGSQTKFGRALTDRGYELVTSNGRFRIGISLTPTPTNQTLPDGVWIDGNGFQRNADGMIDLNDYAVQGSA